MEGDPFLIERGLTMEPPIDILSPFPLCKFERGALPEGRVVYEFPKTRIALGSANAGPHQHGDVVSPLRQVYPQPYEAGRYEIPAGV